MIDRERIFHYLLDIVSAPQGTLPSRADCYREKMLRAALLLRIYHPVAAWILEMQPDSLSESMAKGLREELLSNRARNSALVIQIIKLSGLFVITGDNHPFTCQLLQ